MRLISQIVEIHSDKEVLESAAKTYEYLNDDNFSYARNVWLSKSTLIDTLCNKYKESVDSFTLNPVGDEEKLMVIMQLKKIAVFYSCHDLTSWGLWDDMFERWIKTANSDPEDIPFNAVKYAINACHMGLVWDLHLLSQSGEQTDNTLTVKNKVNEFMVEMRSLLNHQSDELEEEVCLYILIGFKQKTFFYLIK